MGPDAIGREVVAEVQSRGNRGVCCANMIDCLIVPYIKGQRRDTITYMLHQSQPLNY